MKIYLNLPHRGKVSNKGDINYECPKCGTFKLAWNVDTHFGVCWGCASHPGYNIHSIKNISTTSYHLGPISPNHIKSSEEDKTYSWESSYSNTLPPVARAFLLADKNLPESSLKHCYWDGGRQCVGFLLYDTKLPHWQNQTMYQTWMSRRIDYKFWKFEGEDDKAKYIYRQMHHSTESPLFLVEGIFDALSIAPYCNVIALLGTTLYDDPAKYIAKSAFIEGRKHVPVILWMDYDKAGKYSYFELVQRLKLGFGIQPLLLKYPFEPNDVPADQMHEVITKALNHFGVNL